MSTLEKKVDYIETFLKSKHSDFNPDAPIITPPESTTPPTTTSRLAENGVLQIYDIDTRVPPWTLGFGDWAGRVFKWGTNSGTGKNTVVSSSASAIRFSIKCKPTAGDGTTDLGLAAQRGYLDSSADWKSVELTGYIDIPKVVDSGSYKRVTLYGPSGRHPAASWPDTAVCTGNTYKGNFRFGDGTVRFDKENYHNSYTQDSYIHPSDAVKTIIKAALTQGKRVGYKFVNQLLQDGRRLIELWVDIGGAISYTESPKNKWLLVANKVDNNNWGKDMTNCKAPRDQQTIHWGGPHVTVRTDGNEIKMSLATVREIKPRATTYSVGTVISS